MHRADIDPAADGALVRALLAGNPTSVTTFAQKLSCVPRMLTLRNARAGRPLAGDELQDVEQETYLVILRQLPSFVPRAPLESWIYAICCLQFKAAMRRKIRRSKLMTALPEQEPPASGKSTAELLEDAAEAHSMLAELPAIEADVLRLKHFEGLTFEDLGTRLGLSPNTVKTAYYRGLSMLRTRVRQRSTDTEANA